VNKTDLEQLADLRLAEAVALLNLTPPMPDAAYYLAGYAVECALKACIAKLTAQHDFPDKNFAAKCFTHKAKELVLLAGLESVRAAAMASDAVLAMNWLIVKDWKEESRYERWTVAEATVLIDAIREPNHGVLQWVKGYW
jgi:hypothetical protein